MVGHDARHRIVVGPRTFGWRSASGGAQAPWHFLYFLPEPHQHGSLRPICSFSSTRRCCTAAGMGACGSSASTPYAPTSPPYALGWSSSEPPEYCRMDAAWLPALGRPSAAPLPLAPSTSTSTL